MSNTKALRIFVEENILPEAIAAEKDESPPSKELYLKMGQFGLLASRLGPGNHLNLVTLPGGTTASQFDYFHEVHFI